MTTEERSKRRRGAAEAPSPQDVPVALDQETIREIVDAAIQSALNPILDQIATLATEIRKIRIALGVSPHRFGSGPDEDGAGKEEWLSDEEAIEQQSQTDLISQTYGVRPRGQSGRTSFRAGLPVKEPEMLEILPRTRKEGK